MRFRRLMGKAPGPKKWKMGVLGCSGPQNGAKAPCVIFWVLVGIFFGFWEVGLVCLSFILKKYLFCRLRRERSLGVGLRRDWYARVRARARDGFSSPSWARRRRAMPVPRWPSRACGVTWRRPALCVCVWGKGYKVDKSTCICINSLRFYFSEITTRYMYVHVRFLPLSFADALFRLRQTAWL